MNTFLLGLAIFLLAASVIELVFYSFRKARDPQHSALKRRLRTMSRSAPTRGDILRSESLSAVPLLHSLLTRLPWMQDAEQLRRQANSSYPLGVFFLTSLMLFLVAYIAVLLLSSQHPLAIMAALMGALSPWGYLMHKKRQRIERFRHQLPEALEMMARSLRAGHGFTSGLNLTSEQFDDPLGPELGLVIDEINFGVSVPEALKNLSRRIDSPEVNFFVTAVIMQRETGGNLAEIIEGNATLIRERFKFQNYVKSLTAEGKYSAVILFLLPFLVGGAMYVLFYGT